MVFTPHSGPADKFPPKSSWATFETIFNANKAEMAATGDTASDITAIHNGVLACAKKFGVEERVIFCIIMQESTGNVGVRTTWDQDKKPTGGLMQNEGEAGHPGKHNLPQADITGMISTGTKHFKDNLIQVGNQDTANNIYRALRLYNSGSINESNLSDGKGATPTYVSDIANRLQGHTR